MPNTVQKLLDSAKYFSDLGEAALNVAKQYRKAAKLSESASNATKKAMEACDLASSMASSILPPTAPSASSPVPCIITETSRQKHWDTWLNDLMSDELFMTTDTDDEL